MVIKSNIKSPHVLFNYKVFNLIIAKEWRAYWRKLDTIGISSISILHFPEGGHLLGYPCCPRLSKRIHKYMNKKIYSLQPSGDRQLQIFNDTEEDEDFSEDTGELIGNVRFQAMRTRQKRFKIPNGLPFCRKKKASNNFTELLREPKFAPTIFEFKPGDTILFRYLYFILFQIFTLLKNVLTCDLCHRSK
jgi:hypothetical protein